MTIIPEHVLIAIDHVKAIKQLRFCQVDPTRDSSSHLNHCGTSQSPSPASATCKQTKMLELEQKAHRAIAEHQRHQRKKEEHEEDRASKEEGIGMQTEIDQQEHHYDESCNY